MLLIVDRKSTFLLSGTGDLIEPDDGIIGIGSGGAFAQAAAKALARHSDLDARAIAEQSMKIAAEICVYTNTESSRIEELVTPARLHVIRLPERTHTAIDALTPREIVAELDKYVVGQKQAKRAVAIALRNRMRRQKLPPELADEVAPKNILMIGPTGVGKTEIARRLAKLAQSPFLKVEASKFTEVGYVGRDVESMVRDLVEIAVGMVRDEQIERGPRQGAAERRGARCSICCCRRGRTRRTRIRRRSAKRRSARASGCASSCARAGSTIGSSRSRCARRAFPSLEIIAGRQRRRSRVQPQGHDARASSRAARRRSACRCATRRTPLAQEEEQKLIDMDQVARIAVDRVQQAGIIFIDEIDKIAGREGGHGPDVSREGVQRDILPIVEGTTVNTKHGMVRTDHILFIAAGAFHVSKPSDLIPELQGRFPIRVELEALGQAEFVRILTEPRSALVKQYIALMATEGVELTFTDDAIELIAEFAALVNERTENIGARRLHTVMERLLDEISFEGPELAEKSITDRRRLRSPHARRHRQERRSVPLHPVNRRRPGLCTSWLANATRCLLVLLRARTSRAARRARRCRRSCGSRRRAEISTGMRIDEDVFVRFTVPTANVDGHTPADVGARRGLRDHGRSRAASDRRSRRRCASCRRSSARAGAAPLPPPPPPKAGAAAAAAAARARRRSGRDGRRSRDADAGGARRR